MPHSLLGHNYAPARSGNPGGGGGSVASGTPHGNINNALLLSLQDQVALSTVTFPTHWSVPFAQAAHTGQVTTLLEQQANGTYIPVVSHAAVAGRWPDGSTRFLHVYGAAKWAGGTKKNYAISYDNTYTRVASPLSVTTLSSGYLVDTGATRFVILNTFDGIHSSGCNGGGPTIVDSGNNVYTTANAGPANITVEVSGDARITFRISANLVTTGAVTPTSFASGVTRITAYAGSPLIDINHATIFTDDMRKHPLRDIGFRFNGNNNQILTRYLTGKAPAAVASGHFYQYPPGMPSTASTGDYSYANAYKYKYLTQGPILNFVLPSGYEYDGLWGASILDSDSETYNLETGEASFRASWNADYAGSSMHNEFALNMGPSDSSLQDLYEARPIGYRDVTEAAATKVIGNVAAYGGTYQSVDDAAINSIVGYYHSIDRYQDYGWHIYGNAHHDQYVSPTARPNMYRVWSNNHYNQVGIAWNYVFLSAQTGVLRTARIAVDNYCSMGQVKCSFRNHGSGYNGAPYSGQVDSVTGQNSTDYYRNAGAWWHCKGQHPVGFPLRLSNTKIGGEDHPNGETYAGFSTHYVNPTGPLYAWYMDADQWARESYELWLNAIGNTHTDDWLDRQNFYSWLTGSFGDREVNNSLFHYLVAYEYAPNTSGLLTSIRQVVSGLVSNTSLVNQAQINGESGIDWYPEWISKYDELFPNDSTIYITSDSPVHGTSFSGLFRDYAARFHDTVGQAPQGLWSMSVGATAYNRTGNPYYATQYAGLIDTFPRRVVNDPSGTWTGYGNSPGPDVDGHWTLQWPRLKYALVQIGSTTAPYASKGFYLTPNAALPNYPPSLGNSSFGDAYRKGLQCYVLNSGVAGPSGTVVIDMTVQGNIADTCSIYLITPGITSGTYAILNTQDHLNISAGYRNASGVAGVPGCYSTQQSRADNVSVYRETHNLPATGFCKLVMGVPGATMRPFTQLPEAQLIQNYSLSYRTSSQNLVVGYAGNDDPQAGTSRRIQFYTVSHTSGVIYPIVSNPITYTISSTGTNNATGGLPHVRIGSTDKWLRYVGDTVSGVITDPTTMIIDGGGLVKITFVGSGNEILNQDKLALYGDLASIQTLLPYATGDYIF